MNCDNDFNIPYNRTYIKVKPFCESTCVHYKVYLHEHELKLQKFAGENGEERWNEFGKGKTQLAQELGRLIEEHENKP